MGLTDNMYFLLLALLLLLQSAQAKEFFGSLEPTLMGINILVSSLITALVLYVFPEEWHSTLTDSSQSVAVLGALLSFALVFRTQVCGGWYPDI